MVRAVAVVVTRNIKYLLLACILSYSAIMQSAILPEDRADILYHSYDGGGVEINGPSILVRKKIGNSLSVSGNYYVDSITSASIDVVATASPYSEERNETGLSMDYLHDNVTLSSAFSYSKENDFTAKTLHLGVSQEIFGGMTTVSLGYSRGWDEVGLRGDPTFSKDVDRQNYRLSVSQVLSKNMLMEAAMEAITDEGYLNNPYRRVRYLTAPLTFAYQNEVYPNTRTSTALTLRTKYYLPYHAALHGEYRYFQDTWGIKAHTFEVGYTHPFKKHWIIDLKVRGYSQNKADFYNDLFPFINAQNFLARDKELSTFSNLTLGVGVSYEFAQDGWYFIDKGTLNFSINHIRFNYDDFRNVTAGGTPGTEPLYKFNANVMQLFLSVWY